MDVNRVDYVIRPRPKAKYPNSARYIEKKCVCERACV